MPDIRRRKGFLFFMIFMILLSFVHAVSVESPVTSSMAATYQRQEEAQGTEKDFSVTAAKPVVTFEAAEKNDIHFENTLIYRAPTGRERISEMNAEVQDAEGRSTRSRRYHGFRFLTVIFIMFCLPDVVLHIFIALFGSSCIELLTNIHYIHWSDGKKGIRFCILKG